MRPQNYNQALLAATDPNAYNALLQQQRTSTWNTYHSKVRFQFGVTGAGPFVYKCPMGTELRAFGYAKGQAMDQVGMPAGTLATGADTNLVKASETVAGERVIVYGVSAMVEEDSDGELAKALFPLVSVTLALNGEQQSYPLGTLAMVPQSGGLMGSGQSYVGSPPIAESIATRVGTLTNGLPTVQNFLPFPQPLIWASGGQADSTLVLKARVERDATYTTLLAADRAAAAGIAAWAHPTGTNVGTFVGIKFRLWSRQVSLRSVNS